LGRTGGLIARSERGIDMTGGITVVPANEVTWEDLKAIL
jgi:hypothetical protein